MGARARSNTSEQRVAVTTLFDNTALQRRHLGSFRGGRVAGRTWALFALGSVGMSFALYGLASGRAGLGCLAAMAACGTLVFAMGRARQERRSPHFILGEGVDVDLPVMAPDQPQGVFELLRAEAHGYELRFTSSMEGWLSDTNGFSSLAQLIAVGRAQAENAEHSIYSVTVPPGSRAQVELGAHAVAIESVDESDPLKGGAFNWSSQLFTGLSFFLHAILLALVLAVPADGVGMTNDIFGKDNRFVSYLVRPSVAEEQDLLKMLKKNKDAARAGARHRGPAGKAGDKKAPKRRRRLAVRGPADNLTPAIAKAMAEKQARTMGVLGALKNSRLISSIFATNESALGNEAEDALGNLIADAPAGPAYGIGGLAPVGLGRGGGYGLGDGLGLMTIGDIGPGTKLRGKWTTGEPRLRPRKPSRLPPMGFGKPVIRGALDKSIVRRYIRQNLAQFKYCYTRSLQQNAKLQGRVVVKFVISGSGQVSLSKIERSTMGHAPTEQCLVKAMRRIVFPKPQGGGMVVVSYPFVFRSAGSAL